MELTQGNMAALFQNLRGEFRAAVRDAPIPEDVAAFVTEIPSGTSEEYLPTAALLGDLEKFEDELSYTNLGQWMQEIANETFARGLEIPITHVEDDRLAMYTLVAKALGKRAATYPYRQVPQAFINGISTAWVDGANVWSNSHQWVGGQAWDNLEDLALSPASFETACQHLMERIGPDGQVLELSPTHLVVGPANLNRARRIVHRELVGGGDSNIHHNEVQVVKWSQLIGTHAEEWGVFDLSDEVKPCAITNRSGPDFFAQDSETDDSVFNREVLRYKGRRRFGIAILAPWLGQWSDSSRAASATTAAA